MQHPRHLGRPSPEAEEGHIDDNRPISSVSSNSTTSIDSDSLQPVIIPLEDPRFEAFAAAYNRAHAENEELSVRFDNDLQEQDPNLYIAISQEFFQRRASTNLLSADLLWEENPDDAHYFLRRARWYLAQARENMNELYGYGYNRRALRDRAEHRLTYR